MDYNWFIPVLLIAYSIYCGVTRTHLKGGSTCIKRTLRFQTKQVQGNKYIYLFMKTVILQQKCKYAYGYKFNEKRMQKQSLLLPVDESGNPDYAFMEQYIKEREQQIIQKYIKYIGNNIQIGGGV